MIDCMFLLIPLIDLDDEPQNVSYETTVRTALLLLLV